MSECRTTRWSTKWISEAGDLEMVMVPIEGNGLWSTLYGFLALDADTRTVVGITFYEHKETPGLGGEVDNPRWKALWPGRKAFLDEGYAPKIEVIKGAAGRRGGRPLPRRRPVRRDDHQPRCHQHDEFLARP